MSAVDAAQSLNLSALQVPGIFEPVVSSLQGFVNIVQWLLGGLFGLYMIFVVMSWWQGRVKLRLLRDIREDLDLLNLHFKVKDFREHPPEEPDKRWEKVMMKLFEDTEKGKPVTTPKATQSRSAKRTNKKKKDHANKSRTKRR